MQNYPAQVDNENVMNTYAQEYLNTVKENRSQYGNFVDNNLTYDPYKEQKSVYNVVYETDAYNPWGKPGGGAPKLDSTGNLKTKIVGTLKWNLNGETEEDRMKRLANSQKNNNNALLYKKNFHSPQNTPRMGQNENRQATTYNYNYRDPYVNSSLPAFKKNLPPISNQQNLTPRQAEQQAMPAQSFEMTKIEHEAHQRKLQKPIRSNLLPKQGDNDFNRISNKLFIDNKPSMEYPNNPYWFGRAGPGNNMPENQRFLGTNSAPLENFQYYDVRKRNLLDALENRIPNNYQSSSNNFGSNSQFVN